MSERFSLNKRGRYRRRGASLTHPPFGWLPAVHLALPRRRHGRRWPRIAGGPGRWSLVGALLAGVLMGAGLAALTIRRASATRSAAPVPEAEVTAAWPELTREDLEVAGGDVDRLADAIRVRTGENAESVRAVLHGMAARRAHENGQSAGSH